MSAAVDQSRQIADKVAQEDREFRRGSNGQSKIQVWLNDVSFGYRIFRVV